MADADGARIAEPQQGRVVFSPILNYSYLRSLPGTIALAELACGLLVWALIAATPFALVPAYRWVMFVALFCWIVTLLLVLYQSFTLPVHCLSVPWPLFLLCLDSLSAVMYLTAFITDAASVQMGSGIRPIYDRWAASTFFALICTLLYAAASYVGWLAWRDRDSGAAETANHGSDSVPPPYQQ